jgi:hypothetical protein
MTLNDIDAIRLRSIGVRVPVNGEMKNSYSQLLRAFLFALVIAAGFATVKLVAQAVCGNPLECFAPGQEGEMWQALVPFGQTNTQVTCTNSEHPDLDGREPFLPRQCQYDDANGVPYPVLMPPKLGQMLDPFMLAVDGERIYVSDQSNHRIQAFKFDGTPIPLAHPIGDGIPGSDSYGPYPADSRLTGHNDPITGIRLFAPDGLAVDAEHKLVVADAGGFVNVFNPDGSPAFGTIASPERIELPDVFGEAQATGVAMTPGTIVRGIGVPVPLGDNHRIVVTDLINSVVFIYDSGFNLVQQVPENIHQDAFPGSAACVWDENAPLGNFCTPVAAAIDNAGRIYISEYDNNRIQVLDFNGNPLGYFGSSDLQYPWGITLDHRGRLVVADTENQRFAFFNVDFTTGPPVSTFIFELDAAGTLNGNPTGIVEQAGTGEGLDPAGRFLVTDTLNNRVQRFQLPDLAVINAQVDFDAGTGTFQVAVPAVKAAIVDNVGVSVQGVNATVLTLNGVSPANPAPLDPLATAEDNATEALGTDIAPGQIATYSFTFDADTDSAVSFFFRAVGNGGITAALPTEVTAEAPCLSCESMHTAFVMPPSGPPTTVATPSNGWYSKALTIRVHATTTHSAGLSAIGFQFLSGPESGGLRWGGDIHLRPASGAASSTDFNVITEGVSTFRYWSVGADGTVEESHFVTLSLDLTAPSIGFTLTPNANAAGWNNTTVDGTYRHTDIKSGPVFTDVGTFSFVSEGRDQWIEQTATDRAGNTSTTPARSNLSTYGGRIVNIDKTAPTLTVPGNIQIVATGDNFGVIPPSENFVATALDPPLSDPRTDATNLAGSGVVAIGNPGAHQFPMGTSNWPFTATDAAGNVRSANVSVTVVKATGTIAYTGLTSVQYGSPLTLSANVTPSFATGQVTFTLAGGPALTPVTLSGANAATTIASVLKNVGTYTLTIAYGGSNSVTAASTQVDISVTPAPVTVTANPQTKVYGAPLPNLTAPSAATVVGAVGVPVVFSLATTATATSFVVPGGYPITVTAPPAANPNYTVTPVNGILTVTQKDATLTADDKTKGVGTPDPPLTTTKVGFLLTDGVIFSASRVPGEGLGPHTITPAATGAAVGSYNITIVTGTLTIVSNQPPVCGVATGGEIWPPNHKKFQVAPINGVTDPDGDPITLVVTGILQDEHVDSTGDGQFSPDGVGVGTSTASLRAERNGHGNKAKGDGRVYQISFTASDPSGATCTGAVLYTVPHDQGQGGAAVNSGLIYDSTVTVPGTKNKK